MKLKRIFFIAFALTILAFFASGSKAADAVQPTPAKPEKKPVVRKKKPAKSQAVNVNQIVSKPKSQDKLAVWLKDLKKRLAHSRAQQNKIVAVAAVRGNETVDAPPLYWIGKTSQGEVITPELK